MVSHHLPHLPLRSQPAPHRPPHPLDGPEAHARSLFDAALEALERGRPAKARDLAAHVGDFGYAIERYQDGLRLVPAGRARP